ncbi:MAG: UbiA prenyltransferase family protein [Chitinophagaceae bacterium]|nr:UbiA prenyltransferase family protein [Chitinophagaceae bacterium]
MLQPATLQLLRFHFSFFLLPVYLFALAQVPDINTADAVLIFFILHFLVYPSSNGYNSYMDRDEGSIGGIEKPMAPTRQLFQVSIAMDIAALFLSFLVSSIFLICVLAYILASRAYSYRGIRLKKYPWLGYFTVVFFQGAVTFFMVYHGSSQQKTIEVPVLPIISASLLMGSFYPLTQIYQHKADLKDGVKTISYLMGYRGTFVFTAVVYGLAMGSLAFYFNKTGHFGNFFLLATLLFPVLVYFIYWAIQVWKDTSKADFKHTMRMNVLASCCSNAAFLTLLILSHFE